MCVELIGGVTKGIVVVDDDSDDREGDGEGDGDGVLDE